MECKLLPILTILVLFAFPAAIGWFSVLSWTETVSLAKDAWGLLSWYNVPFYQDVTGK